MTVREFVDYMKKNTNKAIREDQVIALVKKTLEVKEYLGIKEKKQLVDNIVNECVLYEDGVFKFNEIDKYICFTMRTIAAYTNLVLSADIEEDYDMLCKTKMLNMILESFLGEYDSVKVLLQMECDYTLSSNVIEAQIGRFLTALLDKVDGVITILGDKINDLNLKDLPINAEDFKKLLKFIDVNQ